MVSPSATSGGQPKAKAQSAASSNSRLGRVADDGLAGASFEQPFRGAHDRQKVARVELIKSLDWDAREPRHERRDLAVVAVVDFVEVEVEQVFHARAVQVNGIESHMAVLNGLAELNSDCSVLVHEDAFFDLDVGHGFGLSKRPENGPEKRRKRRG